jgi:hypothetical protein
MSMRLLVVSVLLLSFRSLTYAASCCGSNVSTPALITTGETSKVQFTYSQSRRYFEVPDNSLPILLENKVDVPKLTLKASQQLSSELQAFAQTGLVDKTSSDTEFGVGHELIFSDTFQTMTWLSHSFPTGSSVYSLKKASDVPTGSGQHSTFIGGQISRIFAWGDVGTSATAGYSWPNKIHNQKIPSQSLSTLSLGIGFNRGPLRFGLQQEVQATSKSLSWPLGLNLSYLNQNKIWVMSYSDETLFGPVRNTNLNRSFSLSFIHRVFK